MTIFASNNIDAQVKTKIFKDSIPSHFKPLKSNIIKEYSVTAPAAFENLSGKDPSAVNAEYINRYAIPVNVDIDIMKLAEVSIDAIGKTYSLTIKAEKARNISIRFNEFQLSPNSVLSIYTHNELTDSITAKENNKNMIWATRVYQGNILNIVLKVPIKDTVKPILKINKVNFGYKKFGTEYFGNPGASAGCHINTICPEGNGWQNEANSIALIVSGGDESCTGSLIMNTCNSNIPYLLTANHCLDADVANWVFQFQYWSATCATNSGWNEDVQFNGCTVRANHSPSDFALLELNQTPTASSGIFYSGWDRSNNNPFGVYLLVIRQGI